MIFHPTIFKTLGTLPYGLHVLKDKNSFQLVYVSNQRIYYDVNSFLKQCSHTRTLDYVLTLGLVVACGLTLWLGLHASAAMLGLLGSIWLVKGLITPGIELDYDTLENYILVTRHNLKSTGLRETELIYAPPEKL
jgi:hypothetical protein